MADPNEQTKPDEAPEPASIGASEGPPADGEAASPEAAAPQKRKKKERDTADPGEIRDRNRRIREEAAAKRKAKREAEARRAAPARNLDASEIVDDALVRTTHAVATWLKRHLNVVQWVVLAAAVFGIGYQIYSYRRGRAIERASDELTRGLQAETGRVGASTNPGPDRYTGLSDTRKEFPTEEARLAAAAAEYRKVADSTTGPTSTLATLGLAGVLYDQGKYAEAQAAYEKVKNSPLATKDRDVRGRAIEGIGLSLEAQKKTDAAIGAFRELANTDIPGLKDLGEYHQARLLIAKGERDKGKDVLKGLLDKIAKRDDKDSAAAGPSYVEAQARELLASVDPSAVPKPQGLTPADIARLKEQLKMQEGKLDPGKVEEILRDLGVPSSAPPADSGAPAPAGSAP